MKSLVRSLIYVVLSSLFAFVSQSARAGYYTVQYVGTGSYAAAGASGGASATGMGVTASISGSITATFTWVPANNNDPAPLSAIVTESSRAGGGGYGSTGPPSATAEDGLGDPATGMPQGNQFECISTGQAWVVKSGSGFSVTCSPSATASVGNGVISVNAAFTALAQPVTVGLMGVTFDSNQNLNILIGQGCQPAISVPIGVSMQNYQWTVTGDTFKDYVAHGQYTGSYSRIDYMQPSDWQQASPLWYWNSESGDGSGVETVTGTANAYAKGVIIGTVTVTKSVTVWCPYYFCGYTAGTVTLYGADPNYTLAAGNPPAAGIYWSGQCIPPDLFGPAGNGLWAFIQMMYPGRWYTTTDGVLHSWSINGLLGLDTSYPYPFWEDFPPGDNVILDNSNYGKLDDDSLHTTSDSPNTVVTDNMLNKTVNENFWTYMMYRPENIGYGNQWVPLHLISWSWSANINNPGAQWSLLPLPWLIGPVTVSGDARCTTHPIWNRVFNAPTTPYVP